MPADESLIDEQPFLNIADLIADGARLRPDAPALIADGETASWALFDRRVSQVANALKRLGLGRGDKVAVLADPSAAYVETYLGTLRAGACAVPLSSMATAEQLALMIDDCGARVLCASVRMRELVEPLLAQRRGLLPGGRIAFDFAGQGWTGYAAWRDAAPVEGARVEMGPDDDFNIIYSSGTTGVPKGILHSHAMRSCQLWRMRAFGFAPDAVTLVSTPLYSNTTLVSLLPTLAWGGRAILMRKFDVAEFLRLSQVHRVTHAMLVPVQYQRLLAHPDFDRFDLSAYRMKLSTSAPLRAEVKRAILDRWPGQMVEIYGLTEGGATCILDCGAHPDKLDTVGPASAGCEVRIIDEQGREVPPGTAGEIVGRAPAMMRGYHNQPEKTAELHWHAPDGSLFFKTGDMGYFDADGFLHLLDRKKDMIISGGFNVYAADLEAVLAQHPEVADLAVIGIPSERWGETPLGLVVRKPGSRITAEALLAWANERLGKGQRLAAIEFRDALPRSPIGKVLKRELREPYWRAGAR